MLTRRGIRVKVMQVLYMLLQDPAWGDKQAEQLLHNNIRQTYRAYLYVLQLLSRLSMQVDDENDRRKSKYIPTDEDRDFNIVFFNNPCTEYLRTSETLRKEWKREGLSTTDEDELLPSIYNELKLFPPYAAYIASTEHTIKEHRDLLRAICKQFLPQNEAFDQFMEDMIPTWSDDEQVVLAKVDETLRKLPPESFKEQELYQAEVGVEERDFAKTLLMKCLEDQGRFDQMIEAKLKNWELDRVSLPDRILMKMALTEFLHIPTIPLKVTINEYLEISKLYSTPKSREFINGILDNLMIELKKEGSIVKTGRGLIE